MKYKAISLMKGGQDGAIFGNYLFRFGSRGVGRVYKLDALLGDKGKGEETPFISEIVLDRSDVLAPHSNAVFFGNEYYEKGDEFPLLYSNVYNNYKAADDKLEGVCCVYRVTRDGDVFSTTLVQLIEIGFTSDRELWRTNGEKDDVRPYGNFVLDTENGVYYAFVMRDAVKETRYFAFRAPKLCEGEINPALGVRKVTLTKSDILHYFDTPYHNYVQGACFHDGKIWSVEGFHGAIHPALRVIDTVKRAQVLHVDLFNEGLKIEPEFIDFAAGRCIYGDAKGGLYELEFEKGETD